MPGHAFQLQINHWKEIHEFPDSWPVVQLREVLALLEFDDPISDEEVADIALMLLQDQGPRLAAETVLEVVFGESMSPGVRQNIAEDLQEDEPWAQHAAVEQQAGIFATVVLLQRAMPNYFGEPEAVQFQLTIDATAPEALTWLSDRIDPALVVRLLAQGMEDTAILNRLYEDELQGKPFSVARNILWCISPIATETAGSARCYSIISSLHWFATLEDQRSWTARASADHMTVADIDSARVATTA